MSGLKDKRIQVMVDETMLDTLRELAKEDRRTVSEYVRIILEEFLANK